MDNRVFNVNGSGESFLQRTLELAFEQRGSHTTCVGFEVTQKHGLILHWVVPDGTHQRITKLLAPLAPKDLVPLIAAWLKTDEASGVMASAEGWDKDADHDGHNSEGWRVYCEDWGHVNGHWSAICAVKPVFLWHGK